MKIIDLRWPWKSVCAIVAIGKRYNTRLMSCYRMATHSAA